MKTIYFIRHGERQDHFLRLFSYPSLPPEEKNPTLSPRGHTQAARTGDYLLTSLAETLPSSPLTLIVSPYKRCLETATHLLASLSCRDTPDPVTTLAPLVNPNTKQPSEDNPNNNKTRVYVSNMVQEVQTHSNSMDWETLRQEAP